MVPEIIYVIIQIILMEGFLEILRRVLKSQAFKSLISRGMLREGGQTKKKPSIGGVWIVDIFWNNFIWSFFK